MNFTWLEDFLALAASGIFSRAAEDRHSSQPAFSRRIRALEEWIGVPLVDRSTQPARLTPVGEWFKSVAEELTAEAARLPGEARQIAEEHSLTLRIASTHALSFVFLPIWLRGLEAKLTIGPIELMSDVLARCESQIEQGKVHFVLTHACAKLRGPLDADTYLAARIGNDQLVPVSKPKAGGQPLHRLGRSKDGQVPILAYADESGLGRIFRAVLGRRLERVHAHTVFTAHLASVLRSMALEGRGVAWLPMTLIEDDLTGGRLAPAGDAEWNVDLEIRLYRPRATVGRAAEALWSAAAPTNVHGPARGRKR